MSTSKCLILSVQGEKGERSERMGGRREHEFDCRDGSIGRSEESDWPLRADGVSRLHALVRYLNGDYFIEDRSTNGMLLNGAPLRKGDPAALKHGDCLQIDTFEISVRLSGETQTQRTPSADSEHTSPGAISPVSSLVTSADKHDDALNPGSRFAPRRNDPPSEMNYTGELIPGAPDTAAPGASLDPLALFDTPPSYLDEATHAEPSAQDWSHTPAISDRFRAPRVDALPATGPVLPDDWDRTSSLVALRVEQHSEGSAHLRPVPAPPVVPAADPATAARQDPVTPTPPTFSTPAPSVAASPELSEMFHIAVDAMMDVLRSRAELKNSFRLPATLIQRSENNPLKFAPTAQDAVNKLLAPPGSGFLSGSAALNDAADDIRNHQMAMLSGVRSAFQSVLAYFDPARIEQETEGSTRRLSLGGRPRHWERYKEQFDALTRNPDECFRRLFGDEFARAYEEQLARLKKRS